MSLTERFNRRPVMGGSGMAAPTAPSDAPPPGSGPKDVLRRRRDSLARRFADLQWDLGGVAYEMAIRDHFRVDVLTKQAAELQEVDAELAGIERMLKLDEAGAAGTCPNCDALYARGAAFCWSCGTTLIEAAVAPAAAPAERPTTEIAATPAPASATNGQQS